VSRLRFTPRLWIGLAIVAAFAVIAIIGPSIWSGPATNLDPSIAYQDASAKHWFGTDTLGHDVFAQTMVATRLTMIMAPIATALAAVGGIALGTAIWVAGPRLRGLGQRLIDVLVSFPSVIVAIVLAAVLGTGSVSAVLAIGFASMPAFARLATNLAATVATRDFVGTARLLGVSPFRLLRRHILPNIAEPLLVLVSVVFAVAIKALAGLSLLGLGVQAPQFDWGRLLASGLPSIYEHPWLAFGPSIAIVLAGVAAGFVGDGLAAAINPDEHRVRRPSAFIPRPRVRPVVGVKDALVRVEHLSVLLADGTRLVDDVSLSVTAGEIVGVVGESGSGKSLTAMSLARLLPDGLSVDPATTMTLGDLDLTAARPDAVRLATEIGIVYQDPSSSLNPTLRVGGQLTEAIRVHTKVSKRAARDSAIAQLERARVSEPAQRMKQRPYELSGGMRQRAMIASAMLTKPRLLIADEPTTALDVTVQADVLRLLQEANQRDGTAILLISHDIGVISAICHRVVVMYAGRIVEELPVERLRAGRAEHPYTKALIAATPTVAEDKPLAPIPGRPPTPAERPVGCAFADRCTLAFDRCATELPLLLPSADAESVVACHAVATLGVSS